MSDDDDDDDGDDDDDEMHELEGGGGGSRCVGRGVWVCGLVGRCWGVSTVCVRECE